MENPWVQGSVFVGAMLLFTGLIILISRLLINRSFRKMHRTSQPVSLPDGYVKTEGNAYIVQANPTSMMINQYPVMQVQIAIFPQDGPMLLVDTTRSFTYAEIPYLREGEPVLVSYEYNTNRDTTHLHSSNQVQNIRIVGSSKVEWEGDATVKDAASQLIARMEGSRLIETAGTILQAEKTDALLGGNPVFRYRVRFQTTDGQWIEGDTYQAARPWLEQTRRNDYTETIQYSATDARDFIFAKR